MRAALLEILACPACGATPALERYEGDAEVETGLLACACGQWYPVLNGVPRMLLGDLRDDYGEFLARWKPRVAGRPVAAAGGREKLGTKESFTRKWVGFAQGFGMDRPGIREFYDAWFRQKLALPDDAAFRAFFQGRKWSIDAGCGSGQKVETMCRLNAAGQVVGLDLSGAVEPAREHVNLPNAHFVQADLMRPPFRRGVFDFLSSDGVLHHTPDTRQAFLALAPLLAPGGRVMIHVYRRLNPIREFTDDHIRAFTTKMTAEECWQAARAFTDLGKALHEMNVTVDVPADLPLLGIGKGKVPLQRLFYNRLFQCFWNETFTYDENNLVNFDWFHPPHAFRHTEDEVRAWLVEAGLDEIRVHSPNQKGVTGLGRRPC